MEIKKMRHPPPIRMGVDKNWVEKYVIELDTKR
jgi:hypothetical protein